MSNQSKTIRTHKSRLRRHALVLLGGLGVVVAAFGCTNNPGDGSSCTPDDTVTDCGGADGYSCAAGDLPPDSTDPSLTCSDPSSDGNTDYYCCITTIAFAAGTCMPDPSVDASCPDPDSLGYSCAGSDTPEQTDPSLTCSPDQGTGAFCCYTGTVVVGGGGGGGGSTCAADPSVTGCLGSDGYSCASGDAAPDSTDATLTCSDPTPDGSGNDLYCCFTSPDFAPGTCSPDPSLDAACPDPESFGYSCAGSDTPEQTDGSLSCSPDQGNGDFCCTTM
jgi:hypothetical protein